MTENRESLARVADDPQHDAKPGDIGRGNAIGSGAAALPLWHLGSRGAYRRRDIYGDAERHEKGPA